ncbi:MAG: NlpC/P60 family protein [Arachidicoccus sp.]|nr:NlpC/P60 family protein [Arachidicoccus sp.]
MDNNFNEAIQQIKRYIFIVFFALPFIFSACTYTKHIATSKNPKEQPPKVTNSSSIHSGKKKSIPSKEHRYTQKPNIIAGEHSASNNGNASNLQYKYASLLDVAPSRVTNLSLFELIDDWYGAPYAIGGNSKDGIDCSGFSKMLVNNIYSEEIPRTSQQQYDACRHIKKDKLIEGDLVFFHTYGGGNITHVGVFLQNNKFVHASSSKGVMISDLDDEYWRKAFRGGGRIDKNE